MLDSKMIGERIKTLRETHGFSRESVAKCLGVTPRFLYDIELGNKGFSVETLEGLAEIFNVTTDYILFGRHAQTGPYPDIDSALNMLGPEFTKNIRQCIRLFCKMRQTELSKTSAKKEQ